MLPVSFYHGCVVAIPSAANGLDDGGVLGVELDLLAQFGDVLIEGPGLGEVVDAPALIEQGVAAKDFAGAVVEAAPGPDGATLSLAQVFAILPVTLWERVA